MAERNERYEIVWLVRRLFRALAQKSNDSLQDLGISAADRAVLEFLYPDQALSVPELAERYQVSRQHVQVTVNGLLHSGYIRTKVNPRHKRSSLLLLSDDGINLFETIKARDSETLVNLFAEITDKDVHVTHATLEELLAKLKSGKDDEKLED